MTSSSPLKPQPFCHSAIAFHRSSLSGSGLKAIWFNILSLCVDVAWFLTWKWLLNKCLYTLEYLKFKGTHKVHQVPTPCSSQDYLKLNHMTKSIIQVLLELLTGLVLWPLPWGACSSDQPPSSEEPFPNVQSELALMQLHSISLYPVAGHQRGEISSSPSAVSLEEGVRLWWGHSSAFSIPLMFVGFYHKSLSCHL